jgi:hypothetical protein
LEDIHNKLMIGAMDNAEEEQDAMDAWAREHEGPRVKKKVEGEITAIDADPDFKGYMDPISLDNEEGAWRVIEDAVDKTLAQYETTLEED